MSSIYRKGRDGYYYYQAYVYNPDTGKNDKRIFHSLGTRDQAEAEKLQLELDLQHEQQKTQPQKENSLCFPFSNWKTLTFVLAIVIIIIFNIIEIFSINLFILNYSNQEGHNRVYGNHISASVQFHEKKAKNLAEFFQPTKSNFKTQGVSARPMESV